MYVRENDLPRTRMTRQGSWESIASIIPKFQVSRVSSDFELWTVCPGIIDCVAEERSKSRESLDANASSFFDKHFP